MRPRRPGLSQALRAAAHLVVWLPFAWAAVFLSMRGWSPVSDGAEIAIRSWDVLSAHGPLVGQATRLASGVFDPGPIEYWLLTLPVHLDPGLGVLWGAALCCMLAASLAVEAAWSVARAAGGLLASALVLGTILWMPGIALQPYWNPWFGVMFLLTALAASWAVVSGKRGWLPVLAIAGSAAAQAHLMFALVSAVLVLAGGIATLVGAIRSRKGQRWKGFVWLAAGFVAAAACWVAPVLQQIYGRHGNLASLIHGQTSSGHLAGLVFGLKALAGSAEPPAMWFKPLQSLLNLDLIGRRSLVFGVVALVVMAALLVVAIRPLRSRGLFALASVGLLASAAAVMTYASIAVQSIPTHPTTLDTLNYLMVLILPVGLICWLTVGAAIFLSVRQVRSARQLRASVAQPPDSGSEAGRPRPARAVRLGAFCAGLAIAVAVSLGVSMSAAARWREFPGVADTSLAHDVAGTAGRIEALIPGQPVKLSVTAEDSSDRRRMLFGLALALKVAGYSPELPGELGRALGPAYVYRGHPIMRAWVVLKYHKVVVGITRPPHAA